jgi:hypothetical protein
VGLNPSRFISIVLCLRELTSDSSHIALGGVKRQEIGGKDDEGIVKERVSYLLERYVRRIIEFQHEREGPVRRIIWVEESCDECLRLRLEVSDHLNRNGETDCFLNIIPFVIILILFSIFFCSAVFFDSSFHVWNIMGMHL